MGKNRLEAFSDGVIVILITIMVLAQSAARGRPARARSALAGIPQLRA